MCIWIYSEKLCMKTSVCVYIYIYIHINTMSQIKKRGGRERIFTFTWSHTLIYLYVHSWCKTATVQPLSPHLTNHPRHSGYWWASKNELINNILLWTPTLRHTSFCQPAKTYNHQLFVDIGCRQENLPHMDTPTKLTIISFVWTLDDAYSSS